MKKIILLISISMIFFESQSQERTVSQDNAAKFMEAYFSPIGESFGAGMNNGWYNTAKPHKLLGFDVTLTLNLVSVPNEMQHFNPKDIPNFDPKTDDDNISPTILGSGEGATIIYESSSPETSFEFTMPNQGILKTNLIPVPMINAGIGLVKQTELDVRYLPKYNFDMGFLGKGSMGLWGLGVKHDLLQWIPVVGNVIPISLSIQAGHTQFNTSFSVKDPNSSLDQKINLNINATTVNLIASKKLLMITAYAGIGYNSSITTFNSNTSFNIGSGTDYATMNVPLDLNFKTQNAFKTNIGLRFNFAIIALQANHTFSKYPVTTLGIGVGLR
tara:strand:- start:157 stop:1146 length:990 start_codon:yes stop_codon:yes gene_type:complete